jgi:conjugal transfer mating pair stabilization protein TraN
MTVYMVYQILDVLVHIVWACEADELELGAKRELQSCHYVGDYCATKALFACLESRSVYCCYNSPLARIVQEGARPQLGQDFGDAQDPDCAGLPLTSLAAIDWSRIDLEAWHAILLQGGVLPTSLAGAEAQYGLEPATTNPYASVAVPSAPERVFERVEAARPTLDAAFGKVRDDLLP